MKTTSALLLLSLLSISAVTIAVEVGPCDPTLNTKCPSTGHTYFARCLTTATGAPATGCRNIQAPHGGGIFPPGSCGSQCTVATKDAIFDKVWVLDIDVGTSETPFPSDWNPFAYKICVDSCQVAYTYQNINWRFGGQTEVDVVVGSVLGGEKQQLSVSLMPGPSSVLDICNSNDPEYSARRCALVKVNALPCKSVCTATQFNKNFVLGDTLQAVPGMIWDGRLSVSGTIRVRLFSSSKAV